MFIVNHIEYKTADRVILSVPHYHIEAGKHTLLLGASGCGKTTLINILAGLLQPTKGTVEFQGQTIGALPPVAQDELRRQNFGFVFQKLHLIGHLTVEQNIALAQTHHDANRVQNLIDELGLHGQEKQYARDLSVGEAQRVTIARAVANNPKIIFADEPTSALDDKNADIVMNLIFDQAEKTGATIIAATHDARIKHRFNTVWGMA